MKAKLTVLSSCVVMFCGHARIMSRRGECLVENCCVMRVRGVVFLPRDLLHFCSSAR